MGGAGMSGPCQEVLRLAQQWRADPGQARTGKETEGLIGRPTPPLSSPPGRGADLGFGTHKVESQQNILYRNSSRHINHIKIRYSLGG
jgi:hypothetical protein